MLSTSQKVILDNMAYGRVLRPDGNQFIFRSLKQTRPHKASVLCLERQGYIEWVKSFGELHLQLTPKGRIHAKTEYPTAKRIRRVS